MRLSSVLNTINSDSSVLIAPTYNLKAKSEVVLAAGAINTPMLLMLSGIGDPAILNSLKIPVVLNNTYVGKGLQVH